MAELPVIPIATDALIADTTHMSAEEMGAYVRLLVAMWRHGAQLPNKPAELARIAGVSLRRWNKISEKVLRPMTKLEGIISQKRLSITYLKVLRVREKKRAGALKRWGNRNAYAYTGAYTKQ
jgi:uncharacterized protein YdaU (DUF1376 family)